MGGRRLNVALLVGGYFAGQGAIFLAQTVLLVQGQPERLAAFGTVFSFAILGSLIVDLGAQTMLAEETARVTGEAARVWRRYWSVTACRLCIGAIVALAVATYALTADDRFSRAYALSALPATLIWSFNATGILDGLRRSGINGLLGSLPYLCSAVALLGSRHLPLVEAGGLLGGALSAGYALALVGQHVTLRHEGFAPRMIRPGITDMRAAGQAGLAVLLGMLPGQLYFRCQLLIANVVLGPAGTALFLYAKQVATAAAQVVGFVRRVEFPDLVARLADVNGEPVRATLVAQHPGTLLGAAAGAVMIAAGVAGHFWLPGPLGEAAAAVAMFGPTVLAGALSTALVQGLQARRRYATAAAIMAVAAGAGVAACAVAVVVPGLTVFVLADLAVYVIAFALSRAALLGPRGMVGERAR